MIGFLRRCGHEEVANKLRRINGAFYTSLRRENSKWGGVLGSLPPPPLRRPTDGLLKPTKNSKTSKSDSTCPNKKDITLSRADIIDEETIERLLTSKQQLHTMDPKDLKEKKHLYPKGKRSRMEKPTK